MALCILGRLLVWIQQQLLGAEEKKTAAVIASRSSSDGASPERYIGMLVELATLIIVLRDSGGVEYPSCLTCHLGAEYPSNGTRMSTTRHQGECETGLGLS